MIWGYSQIKSCIERVFLNWKKELRYSLLIFNLKLIIYTINPMNKLNYLFRSKYIIYYFR